MMKAKLKAIEIMVKNEQYVQAFSMLRTSDMIDMDVVATLEEYVCSMYAFKTATVKKMYAPKKHPDPLIKSNPLIHAAYHLAEQNLMKD
jgi:hypothetical protein